VNLKQMRASVASKTDFDPEEEKYRDELTILLNEAYEAVWNEAPWDFTQSLTYLSLFPDLTNARTPSLVTTEDGQRNVTFSLSIPVLVFRKEIWEGNIIELAGREYTILKVVDDTHLITTQPIRHQADATTGISPATLAEQSDWKIKARYYTLPEDCVEILSLAHRDAPVAGTARAGVGQKVWACANRIEEVAGADVDRTADFAEVYVPIPPTVVPPGEEITVAWTNVPAPAQGDFAPGYYYEFCWAFFSPDGVLGPLSNPLLSQVTTDAQNPGYTAYATISMVSFDGVNMETRPASYTTRGNPEPLEGLRKRVFFNSNMNHKTGKRLGEPKWLEVTSAADLNTSAISTMNDPIEVLDTASSVNILFSLGLYPGNKPYLEFDGSHRRIRPWPRVDAYDKNYGDNTATLTPEAGQDFFRQAEMRYLLKPKPLRYDTDTPSIPWQMHSLIVNRALVEVFLKSDNQTLARYYEKLYDTGIKKLKDRYLTKQDMTWVRGQFGASTAPYRQMFPRSITYNG
jgi:hypothetical protein